MQMTLSFLLFMILHTSSATNGIRTITKHELVESGAQPSVVTCNLCQKPLLNEELKRYNRSWREIEPEFRVPNILPDEIFMISFNNGIADGIYHYACLITKGYIKTNIDLVHKKNLRIYFGSPSCKDVSVQFDIQGLVKSIADYISSGTPAHYDCFAIYAFMLQVPLAELLDTQLLDISALQNLQLLLEKEIDPYAQTLLNSVDLLLACIGPERSVKACFEHLETYVKNTLKFKVYIFPFLKDLLAQIRRKKTKPEEIEAHIFRIVDCYQECEKRQASGVIDRYLVEAFLATEPSRKQLHKFIEKLIMSNYSILLKQIQYCYIRHSLQGVGVLARIFINKLKDIENYKNIFSNDALIHSISFIYVCMHERKPFSNFFFYFIMKRCIQTADKSKPVFNGINFENGLYGAHDGILESMLFTNKENNHENLLKSSIASIIYDLLLVKSFFYYIPLLPEQFLDIFKKGIFMAKKYSKTPQKYCFMSYCLTGLEYYIKQYFSDDDVPSILRYASSKPVLKEIYKISPDSFFKEFRKTLDIYPRIYPVPIDDCIRLLGEKNEAENLARLKASTNVFRYSAQKPITEKKDEFTAFVEELIEKGEFEKSGMLAYRVNDETIFDNLPEESVLKWCRRNHFIITTSKFLSVIRSATDVPGFFKKYFPILLRYYDESLGEGVSLGKKIGDVVALVYMACNLKVIPCVEAFNILLRTENPYEVLNIWLLCLKENDRIELMKQILHGLCGGEINDGEQITNELLTDILEFYQLHVDLRSRWKPKVMLSFDGGWNNIGQDFFNAHRAVDNLGLFENLPLLNTSSLKALELRYNDFYKILVENISYLPEHIVRKLVEQEIDRME
ncbi:hypothetical protein ENBRE01_1808 [Enteropsectra breve]|nr:hypothetical protein ENBRE01_1808 [Enteropsectra breve]